MRAPIFKTTGRLARGAFLVAVLATVPAVTAAADQTTSPQQPAQQPTLAQPSPATQPQTGSTGQQGQPATQAQTPQGRVFGSDAGMIFNQIKPDKAADFEMVIGRLREALQKSENPVRRQQAEGWRVFKSVEPGPNGSLLYIFWVNPAVKGEDYTVSKILAEAFPQEAQQLYQTYVGAYAGGQNLVNLELVASLGGNANQAHAAQQAPPPER